VNTTSQLDLHPDAESLNAFAEQALGAQEREQVLAHLAGCSRCRQVIFLAQQAAADAEAPARVPAARPTSQPAAWFWNWRFAWVPAAALASALALVVTFYPRHTAPASEMAKLAPLSEAPAPTPAPQEQAIAGAAHKPVLAAKSLAGNADFAARRGSSQELAAPSAAPTAEFGASAPSNGASNAFLPSSVESAPQPENAAHFQPEPAVAAWQQEQQRSYGTLSTSADASRQISQKSMRAEAYSAHTSRQAASAGPRMVQQSQAVPASSFEIVTQQQLAGSAASLKLNPHRLPSGIAVVSRATAQHLTLEIDLAGTLFLSGDYGQHWEPVAQQWTGRAIEVRAKTGLRGNTAPATGFELQNDAGSTWASADGRTWTAQ
jgi:anti-sigma factor ChrR (cupin superfamily)